MEATCIRARLSFKAALEKFSRAFKIFPSLLQSSSVIFLYNYWNFCTIFRKFFQKLLWKVHNFYQFFFLTLCEVFGRRSTAALLHVCRLPTREQSRYGDICKYQYQYFLHTDINLSIWHRYFPSIKNHLLSIFH